MQGETADAAPRAPVQPTGKVDQQGWRLDARRKRAANAVEVDRIRRIGQGFKLSGWSRPLGLIRDAFGSNQFASFDHKRARGVMVSAQQSNDIQSIAECRLARSTCSVSPLGEATRSGRLPITTAPSIPRDTAASRTAENGPTATIAVIELYASRANSDQSTSRSDRIMIDDQAPPGAPVRGCETPVEKPRPAGPRRACPCAWRAASALGRGRYVAFPLQVFLRWLRSSGAPSDSRCLRPSPT